MTASPSEVRCATCRALLDALGPPLENVYTRTEWIHPAARWPEVVAHYLVSTGRGRRAICRACGREARIADAGGNRGKLEITVCDAPERAPSAVPPIECSRCATLLADGWPKIVGDTYELMGGVPDRTHGPMGYTPGAPGTHPYPPCRECGRVVTVTDEYRSSGWTTHVPRHRP